MKLSSPLPRLIVAASTTGVLAVGGLLAAPAHAATTKLVYASDVDQSETRSAGSNTFLPNGGVDVKTVASAGGNAQSKAAGYFAVGKSLANVGEPTMDATLVSGAIKPGTQLVTDFDGDGTPDGILVGEDANHVVVGGQTVPDWWVSSGGAKQFVKDGSPSQNGDVPVGGSGSDFHGTLDQWRARFPHARVLAGGWSLGSGVVAESVIHSITIGATTYVPTGAPKAQSTITAKVDLNYRLEIPTSGEFQLIFHPEVTISGKVTAAGGAVVDGGTVTVRENGNKLASTTVVGHKYVLPTFEVGPGTHTYQIKFAGAPGVESSTVTETVKVF